MYDDTLQPLENLIKYMQYMTMQYKQILEILHTRNKIKKVMYLQSKKKTKHMQQFQPRSSET